jgi:type I restriction enzyme M protein
LANGALSGGGEENKIRKQIIENDLVEAILILPGSMFYSTDISVSMWIINRNKKARTVELNDVVKDYRDRSNEVLFFDLRKQGVPFEKKFIEFDEDSISEISQHYHQWQLQTWEEKYNDVEEFCKSVSLDEIRKKDYSLVPSKYIDFKNIEENFNFDEKMNDITSELKVLFDKESSLKVEVENVFKSLGYEL